LAVGLLIGIWLLRGPLSSGPGAHLAITFLASLALLLALAWGIHQAWLAPARLQQAEVLWSHGRPAPEVLRRLQHADLARGELGYRMHHLRALALLSLGQRERARIAFRNASLARLPFWARGAIQLYFRCTSEQPGPGALRWGLRLLRLAPRLERLRYLLALHMQMTGEQQKAWEMLVETVPFAADEPLLLEELMALGLARIQATDHLGVQELHPELPYIFEETLELLLHRHGDPRIGWDRTLPARYLALKGRHREVVALALGVPPERRSLPLWETLLAALKQLKDRRGIHALLQEAGTYYPASFRLWMEQFEDAMERQRIDAGLEALEQARLLLPADPAQAMLHWEWLAQRANYAQWVEKDPSLAWDCLEAIPKPGRRGRVPLLRVQVLAALDRYEEAHEALRPLLAQRPRDLDLQLLQAEAMAGLDAWEALLPYLEQASEELHGRADYWHLRGLCHAHLDNDLKARELLERAAYLSQSNLRFVQDAAHACMELAEFERAEQHWRQALKLEPQNQETLIQLAETRRSLRDEEGAKRFLRECLLHHPECEEAQVFLGEMEAN